MIDSTKTIIKWNRRFNWRYASTEKTNIVDHVTENGVYFFSANAWGIKGKIPGGKHSWVALFFNGEWLTLEITDLETIKVQKATPIFVDHNNLSQKQLISSNRHPATMWFGNTPELIFFSPNIDSFLKNQQIYHYVHGKPNIITNNCNTFISFVMWLCEENKIFHYVGYKTNKYWNRKYRVTC